MSKKKHKSNHKISPKKPSRAHKKVGKAPGTVTYLGLREGEKSNVGIIEFDESSFQIYHTELIEQILEFKNSSATSWINVVGLSDEIYIENLGKALEINPLSVEDAVNTNQRPKIDEYEDYIFCVLKMIYLDAKNELVGEHVALVLMDKAVVVFQELKEDVFNGLRDRIHTKSGRIRSRGADYLLFALLDAIIDNYFVVLENISGQIEELEEEVYDNPTPETARKIQDLKKEVLKVRRWISPVKELINRLIESDNPLITKDTKLFLKDLMDHCLEINESLQIYREMSMSLLEMYMSNVSNKMNEVMKVLTIMASIFIPLTFIAGIYGMNFSYMPELQWKYGYFAVWAVMLTLFIGMLIFFKRKRWL
ncbi:magnesium/cobalt transporter CorA [Sediminicola sp. 1XM1-17]|uniref:magnesium/cobalt transporter CorA n=1 Tax=Sediminicola sp. 1XM1-17 TaxID=3127702 RepID=UPI00307867A7